jgi:sugar (pentulose or hexulose) kinase
MTARNDADKADLVIGIDSSTTATKAIAFDRTGKIAAQGRAPIALDSPRPNWYEQDCGQWWASACAALKAVTAEVDPSRIAAAAVSNQRETFAALDEEGRPVRPAIIWLDERCREEVQPFSRKIGARRIHQITGKPPDYAPVVYRLAWMKRNEPEAFVKTRMFADVHSFLAHKLTGTFVSSWASADPLGLFDLRRKEWSGTILRALELEESRLPALCPPGSAVGRVSEEAAVETGLAPGTLVVACGGDGQAAGLGVNALTPSRAYFNLGTAAVCGVYAEVYKADTAFRTMCACAESGYYCECSLRAGTFSVDWLLGSVLGTDASKNPGIYRALEEEARAVPAGSGGLFFLPYLCGAMNPYWDMNARGAFIGLSSSHGLAHIYRAILEGIAFEQSLALSAVETAIGSEVTELMAIGGGASVELWCRIVAEVTGKVVRRPVTTEASGLGAGIAAAVGAGWYTGFRQAAEAMTEVRDTVSPDPRGHSAYAALSKVYARIYPALKSM